MWVLYRLSDGRVIDIQANEMPIPVGAAQLFLPNATREHLGYSVVNDLLVPPSLPIRPIVVSRVQLRRALRSSGRLTEVKAWVAGRSEEEIEDWEHQNDFRATDPIIVVMRAQLGYTQNQVNNLFALAATL